MTTYAGFVADIVAMNVTGVASLATPPAALSTAQLPVRWPMLPSGEGVALVQGGAADERTVRVELDVAIEATGQSTMPTKYTAVQTTIDSVEAALKTLDQTKGYGLRWTFTGMMLVVGGTGYWGLTCLVAMTEYV